MSYSPGQSPGVIAAAVPRSPSSPHAPNAMVNHGLDVQLRNNECRYSLLWGSINVALLLVVWQDLSNKCPFDTSAWYYVEYAFAALMALSVCYHFGRIGFARLSMTPVRGTVQQRRLMHFDDGDKSFVTSAPETAKSPPKNGALNVSNLSWHSSFNESTRSIVPSAWLYNRGGSPGSVHHSPAPSHLHSSYHNQSHHSLNASAWSAHNNSLNASVNASAGPAANASFASPYKNYNKREIITDEHELKKYMKTMSAQNSDAFQDSSADVNTLTTFRSYCNNAANLLKSSLYQMAPATVSPSKPLTTTTGTTKDDLVGNIFASPSSGASSSVHGSVTTASGHHSGNASLGLGMDAAAAEATESLELQRLVANGQLTQSIYNLRGWLSTTIVQRLDEAIDKTNRALSGNTHADCRGFTDVQVGKVGLERLRKTAEVQQLVGAYVPLLPKIVEFVQVSSNQEYLVQRIRDLARGCVLAEYRWNGGGTYGGVAWDEHLPVDSTILFHLFCTYLDGQLPPLPQPGGGRPFHSRYVVNGDKRTPDEIKAEVRNKSGCAILFTNQQRPKFNFITTRTIHNSVHDRNNLFYVIVEFLVYMRTHNEGMLESVNLGRSGINLLRVIGD